MKRLTKIIAGLIVIVILLSISVGIWLYIESMPKIGIPVEPFDIYLEKNLTNKTLTVREAYGFSRFGWSWSNIQVIHGNATLPAGTIDIGDVITNCSGQVTLLLKSENKAIKVIADTSFEE